MRPITPIEYDFYKRRIGELVTQFPHVFNKKFPLPLAIGITQQIADSTEFEYREAAALMKVWCARREYFMMMSSVGSRQDLAGEMSLLNPVHLAHAASMLANFPLKAAASFARSFRMEFGLEPFRMIPEDLNPENKEGYRKKAIPNYIAELHNVSLGRTLSANGEVLYGMAWGNIISDRATYGNHPLRNGAYIHTNVVVQLWTVSGVTFIKTRSDSVYLVRGEVTFLG